MVLLLNDQICLSKDNFQEWQTSGQGAPLPPLTPRDWQISLGDKLLRVLPIDELNDICKEYGDQVINPHGETLIQTVY
jgi:hypothetical protein